MTIEQEIFAHIQSWPSLAGRKMYPDIYPAGASLPVLTYQFISGFRFRAHDGDMSLAQPRVQFTSFSTNKLQTIEDVTRIMGAMNVFPGGVVSINGPFDDYNPDTKIYQRAIEVVLIDDDPLPAT